ncbi:hypothetical protein KFK09_011289 [Dendrobium nobile]|uniref:Uncharacterized protein n=1 Tax=Dendrobium nobile TaxID=94219 RepID=A0A8T3BEI9_DENNO|nr:hypothetical protein KFK09_011289 [Dendrobium nobile]
MCQSLDSNSDHLEWQVSVKKRQKFFACLQSREEIYRATRTLSQPLAFLRSREGLTSPLHPKVSHASASIGIDKNRTKQRKVDKAFKISYKQSISYRFA